MNFLQIVRSLEELLYEVMTWLVFYPRTLWKSIRHPVGIIEDSDREQTEESAQQYADTLSPPLFLLLTILLAHALELTFQTRLDGPGKGVGKLLVNSEQGLLLVRSTLFALYPLMFAVGFVKRSDRPLDRSTLRGPFFAQCYPGAMWALAVSLITILSRSSKPEVVVASQVLYAAAALSYIALETAWLRRRLGISRSSATLISARTFVKASLIYGIATYLLFASA